MRLELLGLLVLTLPYGAALAGWPLAPAYRDGLSFMVLGALTAAILAWGARAARPASERRLHLWGAVAFLCWTLAEVVETWIWDGGVGWLAVAIDALYLAVFAALLLATDDARGGAVAARAPGLRRLERLSLAVCLGGLLLYFVIVPARTDPEGYLSAVPSSIFYLWLDALLLIWFAWRGRHAVRPRERLRWVLLRTSAVFFACADALDLLAYSGSIEPVPPVADLLWFLPFVSVVAAVRVGPVERASRPTSAEGGGTEPWNVAFADLGWSLATLMPMSHLVTEALGGMASDSAVPRRVVVVVATATLLALAVVQQRRVARVQQRLLEEVEAMRARDAAGSRLEAIGSLAGGVAHDFRHLVEELRERCAAFATHELDAASRRDLAAMARAAERAAALTQELLAVGQREPPQRRAFDLRGWLVDSTPALRELCGGGIELVVDAGAEALWCEADAAQLERVAINLVANARDAMAAGGRLEIRLSRRVDGDAEPRSMAVLAFRDHGSGMDRATRERIFEPFFTTKTERVGHGLGLATALGLVRAHGGDIRVESSPGSGSRFEVLLPLGAAAAAVGAAPSR